MARLGSGTVTTTPCDANALVSQLKLKLLRSGSARSEEEGLNVPVRPAQSIKLKTCPFTGVKAPVVNTVMVPSPEPSETFPVALMKSRSPALAFQEASMDGFAVR